MSFILVCAGGSLQKLDTSGVITTLTLPLGVQVESGRMMRAAILNRQVVLVNAFTENLWVDPSGTVRRLTLKPPATRPLLAAGSGTGLNGVYRVKYTNYLRDPDTRQIIAESDFSPESADSPDLSNEDLAVSQIELSTETIDGRRLYRTTSGPGEEFFKWLDFDGNHAQSIADSLDDDGLGIVSAPTDLGPAPGRFELIVEWKDRLWAKSTLGIDNLYFSANRKHYSWPASNSIPIKPLGGDDTGINGLIPRRDELGVAKLNVLWKLLGNPPDLELVKVAEGVGVYAPDSIVIIRDVAYFLGTDGIYTWGPDGVRCISDGIENGGAVRSWFNTDTYFNRERFPFAFGRYNQRYHAYELHLAAAGSSNEDRWVTYDIKRGKWLGPHKTAEFTPTFTGVITDAEGRPIPIIGSSAGHLWQMNQSTAADGASAIDMEFVLRHNCKTPDIAKVFQELSVMTKVELAGTLSVTPAVGSPSATNQTAISVALTRARNRCRRISTSTQTVGEYVKLTFRENTINQGVHVHGYELPFIESGRR